MAGFLVGGARERRARSTTSASPSDSGARFRVGGALTEQALRDMAWNGRFLVVGFAAGDIPKIPVNLLPLKDCSIVGVFWLAFSRNERGNSTATTKRSPGCSSTGR